MNSVASAWPRVMPRLRSRTRMRARLVTIMDITTGGNSTQVDSVRAHRQGDRALLEVTEARGVGENLAADLLAVVGQRHELHQQPRTVRVVELPQRVQRLVVDQRLALTDQVRLGALPQHGEEQVVHAREVVVHERGFDSRLGCDPPR